MVLEDYYEPNWVMIALVMTLVILAILVIALVAVALVNTVRQRRE